MDYQVHVYSQSLHAFTRPEKTREEDVKSGFGGEGAAVVVQVEHIGLTVFV